MPLNTGAFDLIKVRLSTALDDIGSLVETDAKMRCPVKTGHLRSSISHHKEGADTVVIGTNVEYAPYVHYGTYKMAARPFLQDALDSQMGNIMTILSKVSD